MGEPADPGAGVGPLRMCRRRLGTVGWTGCGVVNSKLEWTRLDPVIVVVLLLSSVNTKLDGLLKNPYLK